jgi:hypothetical protein
MLPAWRTPALAATLVVYFNNREVRRVSIPANSSPLIPYPVVVGIEHLHNGTYEVFFDAINDDSGRTERSYSLVVTIDYAQPNYGNVPEAPILPVGIGNGGITPEFLAANGDEVIVSIPPWAPMEVGQRVNLIWDGRPMPFVEVTEDNVARQRVEIIVPGDFIRAEGGG